MPYDDIRWNLSSIYPSLESEEYLSDKNELRALSEQLIQKLSTDGLESASKGLGAWEAEIDCEWLIDILNGLGRLSELGENLESFVYALWSVDTTNERIQAEMDQIEELSLNSKDVQVRFRAFLASLNDNWEQLFHDKRLNDLRFYLDEQLMLAGKQMSLAEENLAADLQRCGGDAWNRLHGKLSANLSCSWDGGRKTVTELRALAHHQDRLVRRRAWRQECSIWKDAEISFASALNGVKGSSITMNKRRGWGSTLERSLVQNRLSRAGLDAMLGTMTESLPLFRRYFRAKASYLGLKKLSWYDLFAPIGNLETRWTWEQVVDLIPRMFDTLSVPMGDFARRAFRDGWIDASPKSGKVGGAYCIHLPLSGESRILCNFDGSFDSLSTVAHELGHAWHGEQMKNLPALKREYPMTLAETASIFSETLVFHSTLGQASDSLKPLLLDSFLMGASQVVVDILSRFHFESALMRARADGELSPRELCEMMLDSQQRCYGDVLLEEERHPWMWAVKGHYYSVDLAFYNFPYAFGQLFSLGLFKHFREEGSAFAPRYNELLRRTGSETAVGVARAAGFNIESPEFWRQGFAAISDWIDAYEAGLSKAGISST